MAQAKTKKKKALTEFQTKLLEALKAKTEESRGIPAVQKALKEVDSALEKIQKVRDKYSPKKVEEKSPKKSEKAKHAQTIIDSGKFGCNTEAVAEILSLLLDEKIEVNDSCHSVDDLEYIMEDEIYEIKTKLGYHIDKLLSGAVVVCEEHPEGREYHDTYMIALSWNNLSRDYEGYPVLVDSKGDGFTELEYGSLYTYRLATDEEIEAFVRKTSKNFGKRKFIFA